MATFQGAQWLEEQVESILSQANVDVQLIVSDDGSTDETVRILDARASTDPRIRRLPTGAERLGAAGNFFRLLRELPLDDVDAVALADQDDIWRPGRLAQAMDRLRQGWSGYSSDVLAFWPDGSRRPLDKGRPPRKLDHLFEPAGPGCTYVLKRELAHALQQSLLCEPDRFKRVDYHDWFIYAFARTNGFRWYLDSRPTVDYRQHANNDTGANHGWRAALRRFQRMKSGWYREQILLLADLTSARGCTHHAADETISRLRQLRPRDRLWLASRVSEFRRSARDRAVLCLLLLCGTFR